MNYYWDPDPLQEEIRMQSENLGKTQGEDGIYKPRTEASRETSPAHTWIPDLQPPELQENDLLLLKLRPRPLLGYSVTAALAKYSRLKYLRLFRDI